MAKKKLTVREACSRSKQLLRLNLQLGTVRDRGDTQSYNSLIEGLHTRLDPEIRDVVSPTRTGSRGDDLILRLFATLLAGYSNNRGKAHSRVNVLITMLSDVTERETGVPFPPLPTKPKSTQAA